MNDLLDPTELYDVADVLDSLANDREHRRVHGIPIDIRTGFSELDEWTTFRKGETTILAARTSIGKSALAMNFAINACQRNEFTLFVSLEMTAEAMGERIMAHDSHTNLTRVRKANDENLVKNIRGTAGLWRGIPLKFYTPRSRLFSEIKLQAESLEGLNFLIIDYIQLVRLGGFSRSRFEEVSDLSAGFKSIAQELDIPVLILAQLNRAADYANAGTKKQKPRMSQLKESGALEQDADVVLLMHKLEETDNDQRREILIEKNRQGQAGGAVVLDFAGEWQKFIGMEE